MPFVADTVRRGTRAPVLLALVVAIAFAGWPLAAPDRGLAQGGTPAAGTPVVETPAVDPALERAAAYLVGQQGDDGCFSCLGETSDPGTTADAVVALKAAAFGGVEVGAALAAAAAYLEGQAAVYAATGPGQAAKLALAAVAAGRDPRAFDGVDLLALATGTGMATPVGTPTAGPALYGDGAYVHALAMLALAAALEPVPPAAVEALRATQRADGSWAFDDPGGAGSGDSNTTALVIQALVAAGHGTDPMVASALGFLKSLQTTTGQFAFQAAEPLVADANSTSLAVQAILAVGQDPATVDDWGNATRGLLAFQNVSGAFRYQDIEPSDNFLATLQAVPALAGLPLPVGVACPVDVEAVADGTPVIALPAPARAHAPCVEVDAG